MYMVRPAWTSVATRDRECWKGTCGKRDGSRRRGLCCSAAGCLWPGCGMERWSNLGARGRSSLDSPRAWKPQADELSQPIGWIQGNTRIGPVLEVTTSYLWGKYGVEIRISSLRQSQFSILGQYFSWSKKIRGWFKLQQHRSSRRSTWRTSVTIECQSFCSQIKEWSIFLDTIKRHSENKMEQLNSTKSNSIFEIILHKYSIGLMIVGKLVWQQEEDQKEDISTALIFQEQFCTSALFKDTQDVISLIFCYKTKRKFGVDSSNIFTTWDVLFNLYSIINNGLILGGQDSSRAKNTIFFLPIDPRDKNHQDPEHIDFSVQRRAQYLHSAWKKIKTRYFGLILLLRFEKDWHSFRLDRMQLSSKGHFQLFVFREIENWRSIVWEIIHVSSTTTKDFITSRSRLHHREWWIGLYSWTTASR